MRMALILPHVHPAVPMEMRAAVLGAWRGRPVIFPCPARIMNPGHHGRLRAPLPSIRGWRKIMKPRVWVGLQFGPQNRAGSFKAHAVWKMRMIWSIPNHWISPQMLLVCVQNDFLQKHFGPAPSAPNPTYNNVGYQVYQGFSYLITWSFGCDGNRPQALELEASNREHQDVSNLAAQMVWPLSTQSFAKRYPSGWI